MVPFGVTYPCTIVAAPSCQSASIVGARSVLPATASIVWMGGEKVVSLNAPASRVHPFYLALFVRCLEDLLSTHGVCRYRPKRKEREQNKRPKVRLSVGGSVEIECKTVAECAARESSS